ncbi:MAG: hypothetical protein ABFD44_03670 [Anaerolineaceae bacterium]
MTILDLILTFLGFVLTLMVFSYLLGDNPLFRFATSLFVGGAAGYLAVVVLTQVLLPRLVVPLAMGSMTERLLALVPLVLCLLLLAKLIPGLSRVGSLPMGYLVGVGAAVAIGGAVTGTLFPQVTGTINQFDLTASANPAGRLADALIVLVGAVCTLLYFTFSAKAKDKDTNQPAKRSVLVAIPAQIGQVFIAITLGALFAGIYTASLTALVERVNSLYQTVMTLFF